VGGGLSFGLLYADDLAAGDNPRYQKPKIAWQIGMLL